MEEDLYMQQGAVKEFGNVVDEKKLLRKISWRILPLLTLCYFVSFLDRINIGNAHVSFKKDINIDENTYSLGVSIFFVMYIIFEVPSNIVLKIASPPRWISRIMVSWGICSVCMMFVTNSTGLILCRVFLGFCEAGFFPGMVFYLSLWFTPEERAYTLALTFSAATISGMVGGALAYGIFQMEGIAGLHGWQWLFLLEGLPSIILGVFVWFLLPSGPLNVTWLSEEEKKTVIGRLSKFGQEVSNHKISRFQIKLLIKDYRIWLMCLINMCLLTQVYTLTFFLPAIIAGFGFNTSDANGLSVPIWFITLLVVLATSYHSDVTKDRAWHIIIPAILGIVFWILLGFSLDPIGYSPDIFTNMTVPSSNLTQNYTVISGHVLYNLGYQYSSVMLTMIFVYSQVVIVVIWVTDIMKGGSQLAVASAIVVASGNIGGIVGPLIFGSIFTNTGSYSGAAWIFSGLSGMVALLTFILWGLMKKIPVADIPLNTYPDEPDDVIEIQNLSGWRKWVHKILVA